MKVESVMHLMVAPSPILLPTPIERAAGDFRVAPSTLDLLARKRATLLPEPMFPGRGRRVDISI